MLGQKMGNLNYQPYSFTCGLQGLGIAQKSQLLFSLNYDFPELHLRCCNDVLVMLSLLKIGKFKFFEFKKNYLPSLIANSLQSQNPCHNKSTQHMAPQRSDLASVEGGMTHRVQSTDLGCFPIIQYCILLCITSNLMKKIIIGNPEGKTGGRLLQQWPSTDGPSSGLTQLMPSKPVFCQVQSDLGPSVKGEARGPLGRGLLHFSMCKLWIYLITHNYWLYFESIHLWNHPTFQHHFQF